MTGRRKSAAHRRGRLAGLLLAVYLLSLLMSQVCLTAHALDDAPAASVTETAAKENKTDVEEEAPGVELEQEEYKPVPLCGLPEHTHSAACYDMDGYLICGLEEHQHEAVCYPACGIEAHKHNEDCYDVDGKLICEKAEHEHDKVYCYPVCNKPEHVHTAECLGEDGELVCGLDRHIHGPECCPVKPNPKDQVTEPDAQDEEKDDESTKTKGHPNWLPAQCGIPEHTHTSACRDENGAYICGLVEHSHGRDCYLPKETEAQETVETEPQETEAFPNSEQPEAPKAEEPKDPEETTEAEEPKPEERKVYCGKEEHAHSESCEDTDGNLICNKEAHKHDDSCYVNPEEAQIQEKPLYCGKDEHTHGDGCYDENGELTCTLEAHIHTDECYVNPDEPVTNCGFEAHVHTDACYDENHENILCGKAEHTHTDECFVPVYCGHVAHTHSALCLDAEGNRVCGKEEHTHEESCFVDVPEGMMLTCGLTAHTHTDACYGEDGELICEIPEHQHTEECFSPILEGTVYYPVTDTDDLDPETAYLILGQQEEENCLLTAELDTQPVAVIQGVDTQGTPCVQLSIGEPGAMMAMALDVPEADENVPTENETENTAEGETAAEPEALSNELKWVPDEEASQTLSNVEKSEAQVALSEEEDGLTLVPVVKKAQLAAPLMSDIMLLADGEEASAVQGKFPEEFYCTEESCHHEDKFLTWHEHSQVEWNMNPFGDARNFNLFVLDDFDGYGDTYGNVAVGGNIKNYNNGMTHDAGSKDYSAIVTPKYDVGLILGGTAEGATNDVRVFNGTVIASNEARIDMDTSSNDGDSYHSASPESLKAYFDAARADLEKNNSRIYAEFMKVTEEDSHYGTVRHLTEADMPITGSQGTAGQDLILKGSSHEYNVFNIPASMLASVNSGEKKTPREVYLDIPFGSYTVINIVGADEAGNKITSLDSFGMSLRYKDSNGAYIHQPADKSLNDDYKQTQRTFINFDPDISSVTVDSNSFVYASVLAPKTDIHATAAEQVCFQGNVVCKSIYGTEASGASQSNSILINPFQSSGAAEFRKFVMCETQEENCEIGAENDKLKGESPDSPAWDGYTVDLTLTSIDHVGGSPRIFVMEGMKLDGSLYTLAGQSKARTFYLAPGDYRVQVETIYRNGEPVAADDPIFRDHTFSQVYFTRDKTPPSDLSFMDAPQYPGSLILNIAPDKDEDETIINVYKTGEPTTRVTAVKRWVQEAGGKQIAVDPPEGASVKFRLYMQLLDGENNSVGEPQIVTAPEGVESLVTVDAKSHWLAEWSNLPLTVEEAGKIYSVKYYVKEEKSFTGWSEVANPDTALPWYQNTNPTYSPCEVGMGEPVCGKPAHIHSIPACLNDNLEYICGFEQHTHDLSCYASTEWVIKNEKADVCSFTVTKQWEGLGENEQPPVNEVQVQLYRMAAAAKPSAEDIVKSGQAVGEPVTLTKADNWVYTWDNLPKKTGTQNYYYAAKELTTVFGFAPEYGKPVTSGDAITQAITNKPSASQPGSILVRKQWQDPDGNPITPSSDASATMQLYQQKGKKTAVAGETVPVAIILNGESVEYQVKPGSTFKYSITLWHESTWGRDPFNERPTDTVVKSLISGVWLNRNLDQTEVSGSVVVNEKTELTFKSNGFVYTGDDTTVNSNTVSAPQFSADFESNSYETIWETAWTPYGEKILSSENSWSDYWMDLPLEEEKDGTTYFYRYCVEETACSPVAISTSYTFNGTAAENPKSLTDFTGGTVIVTNRTQEGGPELPKAGGQGAHLYTLGGLLLSMAAGLLMYSHGKRRKEDFASY